jgi:DNA processing protein
MNELALAMFAASRDAHACAAEQRTARFARFAESFDEQDELRRLAEDGFRWLPLHDPVFPARLKSIHDPPPGLFLRGRAEAELLGRAAVAVVGARACRDYGAHVARSLGRALGGSEVVVLSGLARGVDSWAHRGCLEAGGETVAILGCGIDRDYPRAHAALAREIAERGLLVSEYPPGVAPAPWRFPARNRIVAGLALAIVVVEARERSGALITADLALEEGREVLVVPGEITSALSQGTNALLRLGATPATCADDVLEAIGVTCASSPGGPGPAPGSPARAALAALADGATTVDQVARRAGMDPGAAAAALVELELAGLVEVRAGIYRR